jgi:hypothetical protein
VEIGSTYWRLINYGLIATLKYSYQKIFKKKIIHSFDLSKIEDLEIYLYKKEYTKIATSDLINLTKKIQDDLRKYFFNSGVKDVFKNFASTRLFLLGALINSKLYDAIIETGTQNGISASFMCEFKKFFKSNIEVFSVDVVNMHKRVENGCEYVILNSPVRYNFKSFAESKDWSKSIFFHDSDHSKENMQFEFKYAWSKMKVAGILADDIETNSAFDEFCYKFSLHPLYFKLDDGPVVGLVLR